MSGSSLALVNARLRTNTTDRSDATAVLVVDGKIAKIGSDDEVREVASEQGIEVRDLAGATVTPGLYDSHTHPHWATDVTAGIDLGGHRTVAEIREAIAKEHARLPEGAWLRGWNLEYEPFESTGILNSLINDAAPGRPMAFTFYDMHTGLGSPEALEIAGITGARTFDDTSEIVVDDQGAPTGELREPSAYKLLLDAAPKPTHDEERDLFRDMLRSLAAVGLTGGAVMDGRPETVELLTELEERGELDQRLTVHHWHDVADSDEVVAKRIAEKDRHGRLWDANAIKLFSDGVIDTGTAWLHRADTCGDGEASFWPSWERYAEVVRQYHEAGMLIATHAVGDKAVNQVLRVYAELPDRDGGVPFHSVEHLEVLSDEDLELLGQTRATASMQPLHMQWREADLSDNWATRLGEDRASHGFSAKSVMNVGARVVLGSDWPVAHYDPRIGMAWARGRRNPSDPNAHVFEPEERLTGEEALLAYTLWPAQARCHDDRGVIAEGAVGDFTVWAKDPIEATPEELIETEFVLTVVDGRVVHEA